MSTQKGVVLLFLIFLSLLTWLAQDHVFFWDTVQFAGKHGLWFFENRFETLLLPPELDSGHPPVFGWYMAAVWLLFGKSLAVSHWAMFPFLVGIVWQLFRLGQFLLRQIAPYWLLLIALADPVLLGQSVLVSPDIVLAFFFLLALNSLLRYRNGMSALALLGMALISMRGMMVVAALGLWDLWRRRSQYKGAWQMRHFRWLPVYLPAAVFSLAFLLLHYQYAGWVGYHSDSPWAPSFERVDAAGLVRNMVLFVWRWLDYGRVVEILILAYLLFVWRRGRLQSQSQNDLTIAEHYENSSSRQSSPDFRSTAALQCGSTTPFMGALLIISSLLLSISFISYRGLQAHRYLLPAFLTLHLFCLILADRLQHPGWRRGLLWVMFAALLSGNLWIYPERIAQGWDATLAHWPYDAVRGQMLDYLQGEGIPLETVGTAFPEIGPLDVRDLSGRREGFKKKDLGADEYIVYSNVMNDFSDAERQELQQNWQEQAEFRSGAIKMILYKKH